MKPLKKLILKVKRVEFSKKVPITKQQRRKRPDEKNIGNRVTQLEEIFNPEILEGIAKETGLIERKGLVTAPDIFWTLMGDFGVGQASEITGMHRSFFKNTKKSIKYSSWYNRLDKPGFAEFMRESYCHLLGGLYQDNLSLNKGVGEKFSDILMQDGSSFAVNNILKEIFPGRFTKTSPAAIEVHALYSLRYAGMDYMHLAADSISEYDFMPTDETTDMKGTLTLFDAGYGGLKQLFEIEKANGCFMVRMKTNITPRITQVHKGDCRTNFYFENKTLKDVKLKKNRDYDFCVEFSSGFPFKKLRLIALWNPQTKGHVLLLTNANTQKINLKEAGVIYRLRWQVELLFKELKSHTELRKFLTANQTIVEGFIWASLCALLIRRFIVGGAEKCSKSKTRLSFHKAAISAKNFMPDFIKCAFDEFRQIYKCLEDIFEYLQETMVFSNPHRKSSFQLAGLLE